LCPRPAIRARPCWLWSLLHIEEDAEATGIRTLGRQESAMNRVQWNRIRCSFFAAALLLVLGSPAEAATIQVFPEGQNGCRLRSAITAAQNDAASGACTAGSGNDTLVLRAGVHRMTGVTSDYNDEDNNSSGDYDVKSNVTISGAGAANTAIVGYPLDRIFDVHSTGVVTINDVTIVGGSVLGTSSAFGGVIRKRSGGVLTINRSVLRGGIASGGGAMYAEGTGALTLSRVTLFGNTATVFGGGIYLNQPAEMAQFGNLTLSGNTANSGGGMSATSDFRMKNSTVARNGGGGVRYTGSGGTGVNIANSLFVDNNSSGGTHDLDCSSGVTLGSRSYTMIGALDADCGFASFAGIPASSDARLSPLFDYGSGVPVHALLPGSAALNAGNPSSANVNTSCLTQDARGLPRNTSCELGAYEEFFDATVNSLSDLPDLTPGDGTCLATGNVCTLRAALMEANVAGGRWFVKVPPGQYVLSRPITSFNDHDGGDLDVRPVNAAVPPLAMVLYGNGDPGGVRIVSGGSDRVLEVRGHFGDDDDRFVSFALLNATLRGGDLVDDDFDPDPNAPLAGAGVKVTGGKSLFYNVVLADNHIDTLPPDAYAVGGGLYVWLPSSIEHDFPYIAGLRMERFAIVDNSSVRYAGGLFAHNYDGNAENDDIHFVNGTIAGNHGVDGGGAYLGGTVTMSFVSVVDNTSEYLDPTPGNARYAAGLTIGAASTNTVRNTLIAGNAVGSEDSDCEVIAGIGASLVSLGHNLIAHDAPGCTISGDTVSNLIDVDARLGPRTLAPGGMPFYPLAGTSPAIDAVPGNLCADGGGLFVFADARGVRRNLPGNFACDIGAVETEVPLLANGFE
jgi:hypothetical protein